MKKIAELKGLKQIILIFFCYISFCISTYFNASSMFSTSNIFLCFFYVVAYGLLYYLIFEMITFLFYCLQKKELKIKVNLKNFQNLFRFLIIFYNLLYFLSFNLFAYIGYYTSFFLLIINIVFLYLIFVIVGRILSKLYSIKNLLFYYIGAFIFLIIFVLLWGVV